MKPKLLGKVRAGFVLTDIDHTIADSKWRDQLVGDWDNYHQESLKDKPDPNVVNLLGSLSLAGYYVVGVTGRPEKWRALTMKWLTRHCVMLDELLMRKNNNYAKAPDSKMQLIKEFLPNLVHANAIALDDREDVITMYRSLGITAFQVFLRTGAGV
ncbi:MAG: hypothetical protein MN733_15040 [Nitrososphaera sp.]|nr:hypothetical protein [Nitrososphaera sp.]